MAIILKDGFDAKLFSYHKDTKWFVAEASDINFHHCYPIYDDACDVGIALHGAKATVRYYLHETIYRDEDIQVWIFHPIPEDMYKIPSCKGTEVHVLND